MKIIQRLISNGRNFVTPLRISATLIITAILITQLVLPSWTPLVAWAATVGQPDFGDGGDGALVISTNIAGTPIDATASGTAGALTLTTTNPLFITGQIILIHQTQGSGAGQWEINEIAGYIAGTITLTDPLANGYSGKAQVLVLREYTDVTVDPGVTWTAKAWNGTTGGILAFLANGTVTINGTISAKGSNGTVLNAVNQYYANPLDGGGFRGGRGHRGPGSDNWHAYQGEGYPGPGIENYLANGNGGGHGRHNPDQGHAGGGGGGGGTAGANGVNSRTGGGSSFGYGGSVAGTADLATMLFGGGGGGGSTNYSYAAGSGGNGGGIIFIQGSIISMGSSGSINANGGNGGGANGSGGGGAGGSVLLRTEIASLGTGNITTNVGSGGSGGEAPGGQGGTGRIRIEYCDSISGGTISPPASEQQISCAPPPTPTSTITPTPTITPTLPPTPTPTATAIPLLPPIAVAGTSLDANFQLELNASLSSDSDGNIVSYSWQISGEANPHLGQIISLADLPTGEYTVVLTVTDNDSLTGMDTMLLGLPARDPGDVSSPFVEGTVPADGEQEVRTNTNIAISFSEFVDEDTTFPAFSITPLVNGQLRMAGKMLLFIPDGKLAASTTYTVTITGSVTDLAGNPRGMAYAFSFMTE